MSYQEFLQRKKSVAPLVGFETSELPSSLFDFQRDIVKWAIKRGRAAIFAGTGLGKSFMELSWADQIQKKTGGNVLILTPLAVAAQMKREANKFGIECAHVHQQTNDPIQITNYHKLDKFDLSKFSGVVLDESSILKNFNGMYRTKLINDCKQIPYRLAATATPSPNDYMELGNHSEFCGIMSYTDMLSTFFIHDGSETQQWRLKGHAEDAFWKWMASWSVMLQNPSDLGYNGTRYNLPKLHQIQHTVDVEYKPNIDTGMLFPVEARGLGERLKARRSTIDQRIEKAIQVISQEPDKPWVAWCHLNDEGDMLEDGVKDAVQITGGMDEKRKEDILEDFSLGNIRVLVSKSSISGFGMNWQHCSNTTFVGMNDSFEQLYQAIRRFWRFGQTEEVYAHFIAAEIEGAVVQNIRRKEEQCDHMMRQMVKHMADFSSKEIRGASRDTLDYIPTQTMEIPKWL